MGKLFEKAQQTDTGFHLRLCVAIDLQQHQNRPKADRAAEALQKHSISAVYSSDLKRAHDTARAIVNQHQNLTVCSLPPPTAIYSTLH